MDLVWVVMGFLYGFFVQSLEICAIRCATRGQAKQTKSHFSGIARRRTAYSGMSYVARRRMPWASGAERCSDFRSYWRSTKEESCGRFDARGLSSHSPFKGDLT